MKEEKKELRRMETPEELHALIRRFKENNVELIQYLREAEQQKKNKMLENVRRYRIKNRARMKEYSRRYYQKKKKRILELQRRSRERQKEPLPNTKNE